MQPYMGRGRRMAPEMPLLTSPAYAAQQQVALPTARARWDSRHPTRSPSAPPCRIWRALTAQASPPATPQ